MYISHAHTQIYIYIYIYIYICVYIYIYMYKTLYCPTLLVFQVSSFPEPQTLNPEYKIGVVTAPVQFLRAPTMNFYIIGCLIKAPPPPPPTPVVERIRPLQKALKSEIKHLQLHCRAQRQRVKHSQGSLGRIALG